MYSNNFKTALKTGKPVIRRIWRNVGSLKNQFSVQVMQELDSQESETNLIAIFQGIENNARVTAIISVAETHLQKSGFPIEDQDFSGDDVETVHFADKLSGGIALEVEVVENTMKNPLSLAQEPKKNPTTMAILMKNGKAIYRHTKVVPAGQAKHEFMAHDTIPVQITQPVSQEEQELASAQ